MKRFSPLLLLAFILVFSCDLAFATGFLKTSGKTIVDGTGKEVYLKGIGLGGWLNQEGYMLNTSSFANSTTQIRTRIEALIGKANSDAFYQAYYKNGMTRKDVEILASWGFNSLRLPMNWRLLVTTGGAYLEDGFKQIDSLLSWCETYKVYLILDLHAAPGGQSKDAPSDYDTDALLWKDAAYRTLTVNLWKTLAQRYAAKEWIGGYDLINEPAYDLGSNNTILWDLYKQITTAIREVDKNHVLFIEGNWYANTYTGLPAIWDNNLVISFHKYKDGSSQSSISGYLSLGNSNNVPLWLGETGENSNEWFTQNVELLKNNNIGWSWWTYKRVSTICAPLSITIPPEYQVLLNYWQNGGTKPTVAYATDALMKLATNFTLENCTFNKGYIDALFRAPFSTESVKYKGNIIPGVLYAPEYDYGKVGIAYMDKDYMSTNGFGGATENYNKGWLFRNDGVDIEKCNDATSNGYDVGWIESGEWLNYTFTTWVDGYFDIFLRVASPSGGGNIIMTIDGDIVGNVIPVSGTGGNQSWITIKAGTAKITGGTHKLQLKFMTGGFNLSYIQFSESAVAVNDKKSDEIKFELAQNFPNPFNPVTNIKYSIPKDGNVVLKVYDMLGREVTELVSGYKPAGNYSVNIDASNYPSGVYTYRLESNGFVSVKKLMLLK